MSEDPELWRRRVRHDIRHGLGTIILLASVVAMCDDLGLTDKHRIEQLLDETQWIEHLLRRLEADDEPRLVPGPERIRVDKLVGEVIGGVVLAAGRPIGFSSEPTLVEIDALALWRVVRNVLDNACRIARERVELTVHGERGWVVIQVDDDGPGFGAEPDRDAVAPGPESLGLGIVHDLLSGVGGRLEVGTGELGGARVRILLPEAPAGTGRRPREAWRS